MRISRAAVFAGPFLALACFSYAPRAKADTAHHFVTIGGLGGFSAHVGDGEFYGVLGAESTITYYPGDPFLWGFGAFVQGQGASFDHFRGALGLQGNWTYFGLELGGFVEQGSGPFATTLGLHACPFASVGFASIAVRVGVPLTTLSPGDPWGVDLGLVLAFKAPIPLGGELIHMGF